MIEHLVFGNRPAGGRVSVSEKLGVLKLGTKGGIFDRIILSNRKWKRKYDTNADDRAAGHISRARDCNVTDTRKIFDHSANSNDKRVRGWKQSEN